MYSGGHCCFIFFFCKIFQVKQGGLAYENISQQDTAR